MVGFDYFIFLLSSFYNVYIKLFYLFIQLFDEDVYLIQSSMFEQFLAL